MTCHDWQALLAHRFDPELSAPEDWTELREHLDACPDCRLEASTIDSTLAFRGAASWSPSAREIEGIQGAVRTLRRTGRLTGAADVGAAKPRARLRVASAAVFAVALALLPGAVDRGSLERSELQVAGSLGAAAALRPSGAVAPAIDGLDRPLARVYEWGAEDLSVVMVVDESLDV